MKRQKISEFARERGISQDMIKHYGKYGIIKSEADDQTDYRYFNINQGEKLLKARNIEFLALRLKNQPI